MGHFGQKPIRAGWGLPSSPALILNYLGQGAWALAQPAAEFTHGFNPFFNMAPNWAQYPAGRRSRRWPRSSPRRRSSPGALDHDAGDPAATTFRACASNTPPTRNRGRSDIPIINWMLMIEQNTN
jgi:KUP system potassium uptake protein